jgi:hypothetical protein
LNRFAIISTWDFVILEDHFLCSDPAFVNDKAHQSSHSKFDAIIDPMRLVCHQLRFKQALL